MFVDFEKVFNYKPQVTTKVPDTLAAYLSKSLPHGLHYEANEDGTCTLVTDDGTIHFGGINLDLTAEQRKVLGKNYTLEDVLQYAYNAQEPIAFVPQKEGMIQINGNEISVDLLRQRPFAPIKYAGHSFYIMPQKFPVSTEMEVSTEEYSRQITMHRVPNKSLNIALIESNDKQPLFLKFSINMELKEVSLSMTFNLQYAKSIRDIVESVCIYNAFCDGRGYLCGHRFIAESSGVAQNRFDDESAEFWKKVLQIENYLGLSFVPPKGAVDYDMMCTVEQLYQNLILCVATRDNQTLNSITAQLQMDAGKDFIDKIGSKLFFLFCGSTSFDIFGEKFELPCIVGVCNAVLLDAKKSGNKYTLYLSDVDESLQRYTSSIHFKNVNDLNAYFEKYANKQNELISLLYDAKAPGEYL